jgi:hypothetical protein
MKRPERQHYTSTYDWLRHGKIPRVAAGLLVTALAGCASSSAGTSSSQAGRTSGAGAATYGPRTPGPSPSPVAVRSSAAAETGQAAGRTGWCKAAAAAIETAFSAPPDTAKCDVLAPSPTPGDPLVRFTLDAAGVQGFLVELSVMDIPYDQYTQGVKSTTTSSGARYVIRPGTDELYATIAGEPGETGVVEVLTGQGGATPLGAQACLAASVPALGIFGNMSNASLYPTS